MFDIRVHHRTASFISETPNWNGMRVYVHLVPFTHFQSVFQNIELVCTRIELILPSLWPFSCFNFFPVRSVVIAYTHA